MTYDCPAGECSDGLDRPCGHHRWSAEQLRRWREGKSPGSRGTRRDDGGEYVLLTDEASQFLDALLADDGDGVGIHRIANQRARAELRGMRAVEVMRSVREITDSEPGPRRVVHTAWGALYLPLHLI